MTAAPEKQTSMPARICGVALWLLLAGYLLFNKPFATLGIAPVFVGEVVFAAALGVGLLRWRETFVEPLRNSWGSGFSRRSGSTPCAMRFGMRRRMESSRFAMAQ